jgi:annexin A7/11
MQFSYPNFFGIHCDPNHDAKELRHAMKGLGTDEKELIKILGHRNYEEIAAIKQAYLHQHGKELAQAIESETSGDFGKALVGLLKDPAQFWGDALYKAMKGAGTDEYAIFAALIGRTNEDKQAIKGYFEREHQKSLEHALKGELSGDLEKFCLALTQVRDSDFNPVSEDNARGDAEKLYSAGEGKIGTDEKTFINIFTQRSWPHLHRTFAIYETIHKHHTIEKAVESEFSGSLKTGLVSVAVYARNPAEFFADIAHRAMKGVGTNEGLLTAVLVGNRLWMTQIKQVYAAKYGKTLWDAVSGETSGDFKKILLALIGN